MHLTGKTDTSNGRDGDRMGRCQFINRSDGGFDPRVRILLGPQRIGVLYIEGARGNHLNAACRVDQRSFDAGCADIEPKIHACHPPR
jgi:hypothetical protein